MAQNLSAQPGVNNSDAHYVNGKIVDEETLIGEGINQDMIQFFQKLMDLASITANGINDNENYGYQFIDALVAKIRATTASVSSKGTVEKATTAEARAGTSEKYIDAALLQLISLDNNGGLLTKIINIGVWDMQADASKLITHGLVASKIRNVNISIIADNNQMSGYGTSGFSSSVGAGWLLSSGSATIQLNRDVSSRFNDGLYNDPAITNRGYVTIQYLP